MKNLVSVIITTYNEEHYIEKCLSSLLQQTYIPLELVVVDDGSTDTTKEKAKTFGVTLVELEHRGTATARNTAVESSTGEILCFLDADMEFKADFIEKLTAPIFENKTKGTFSKLEYVKNWNKPLARCWNRNNIPPLADKLRIPQEKNMGDDFRAILKSEFKKVNGFDNIGYTDTWSLKKKLGYSPVNAPDAVYYHYNPESLKEVFYSAQWIGKRKYKLGVIGTFITLFKSSILFSIVKGCIQAARYNEVMFIPFKIVYDIGIFMGALSSLVFKDVKK